VKQGDRFSLSLEALRSLRHDLKNPISQILGYSELLEEEYGDSVPAAVADFSRIHAAAQALEELINHRLGDDFNQEQPGATELADSSAPSAHKQDQETENPSTSQLDPTIRGTILVVDDDSGNRELLARRLKHAGHIPLEAGDGVEALEIVESKEVDLILLDVLMPRLDGFGVLTELRERGTLRDIPVIMISALDETDAVIQGIQQGAEDYLPKPFDRTLLRARISACLEKKKLRDDQRRHLEAIEQARQRLSQELTEASNYVRSVLPQPLDKPIKTHWEFHTSSELGGDAFGYHWLDPDHLAIYLLDVCGHGVGAALLSVAAMNMLRSGATPHADPTDPGSIVAGLNEAFQMENQGNMYFTIWYGVYCPSTRELKHACGGHPPALLVGKNGEVKEIASRGLIVGAMPAVSYPTGSELVPTGSRLLVFSDGAYELRHPDGHLEGLEDFKAWVKANPAETNLASAAVRRAGIVQGNPDLLDDLSIIEITFDPKP